MIDVKVLGPGCRKCKALYEETTKAVQTSGLEATVEKVEKIDEIASYGVMSTPALVVGGQVKSTGKIPKADEIAAWIKAAVTGE